MLRLAAAAAVLATTAQSHSSMIMPPARNSIDSLLPAYSGGKHPPTGVIDAKRAPCTNGTSVCNSGQSTFWFSQGCSIGCARCDGIGARIPNYDHCPNVSKAGLSLLLPKWRTANRNSTVGSPADVFKFNPWRAPGQAPVFDPCGMAGGAPVPTTAAAEYNPTVYAKQSDLGSKLKPRPSGTVWKRGTVALARQQSTAPHGGGYIYRLCPANESLSEACFNKLPLAFAHPEKHTLRFKDSSLDREVDATLVTEGAGKGWMIYPWPSPGDGDCMYKVGPGKHCFYPNGTRDNGDGPPVPGRAYCPGCGAPSYGSDGACPCLQPGRVTKPLPAGARNTCPVVPPGAGSDPSFTPDPGMWPGLKKAYSTGTYALEDGLKVPTDIHAGEYVLSYRWDCEMTTQIWQSCADITIE